MIEIMPGVWQTVPAPMELSEWKERVQRLRQEARQCADEEEAE